VTANSQTRIAELNKRKQDILAQMATMPLDTHWAELGELAQELGAINEELDYLGA